MAPTPRPHRLWLQFLRQALSGQGSGRVDPGRLLDLAVAFCGCRAAALFLPAEDGRLSLHATSAVLEAHHEDLEAVLGRDRDGAPFADRPGAALASPRPLVEVMDEERLIPLRGLALALECLAVSVHEPDEGRLEGGFLLALWEEETPVAARLDRAHLAALALSAGLEIATPIERAEEREPPRPRAPRSRRPDAAEDTADARRVHAEALRQLQELGAGRPDPLTGLALHSRLLDALDGAMIEASRRGEPLALVLVDADDLAEVNRAHGARTGDQVLKAIAEILVQEAKDDELVVRYGMEEFALLVPGANPVKVRARAAEIQRRVRERALPGPSSSRRSSVSVGAACLPDPLASDADSLRLKAEQALELARQSRPGGLIIL